MAEYEYTCEYVPGDSKTLDVPDCLSRLITRDSPPDENELHRLKIALQADDMKVKAGSAGALDNEARTELEASVEKRTAEMEAWKEKQSHLSSCLQTCFPTPECHRLLLSCRNTPKETPLALETLCQP
jgi:hypothetical protein